MALTLPLFSPAFAEETKTPPVPPTPDTIIYPEYGSGDGEKYFKWENTDTGLQLTETDKENAQITAKYDTGTAHTRLENTTDNSTTDITGGSFLNQTTGSTSGDQYGGAIYNYSISKSTSKIGNITGDFIGNYASATATYAAGGGAIYNYSASSSTTQIGNITGNFIGNYASGRAAHGGAIDNYELAGTSQIGDINGTFIGNYAESTGSNHSSYGGAINNSGEIATITGDFIGNYGSSSGSTSGGAINNSGEIATITGDFIGNYGSSSGSTSGGAINNSGEIATITGDFIGNYASSSGSAAGGAIDNSGEIGNITGSFINNTAESTNGLAFGGAIDNSGEIGNITGSFINNTAESTNGLAFGGAIFSTSPINISANNAQSVFSGNKTISNGSVEQNAIAMYSLYLTDEAAANFGLPSGGFVANETFELSPQNPAVLTLKAENNGVIVFNDTIKGGALDANTLQPIETPETAFTLNITGDKTSQIYLNNAIINANITLDNTNLHLGRENVFDQSQSLTLNSGSISLNNNTVGTMHIPTLNLNNNTNLSVDVDLANESMDRITADNYSINENAKLNVNNITLLSTTEKNNVKIIFADQQLAQNVQYTGESPIAYSPLYKYNVSYNPEDGFFTFMRGASSSSNPSDSFNPAALTSPVTTQAGAYSTQLQTFNYAFQHSDNFMNLPYLERLTLKSQNKYALSPTGDATDVGTLSPLFTKNQSEALWIKPYSSFESIPLNNGPKVSNINYGSLIGHDSPLTPIKHNFDRVLTTYIAYNGASQRFNGVDAYQNGALIGQTITLYKNNFFNATTASFGASTGSSTNMYGSEHYTMLLAGIANKAGYNLEFKNGKIILQPSFLISYTFVNTFDYNNSAGLRIKSDPLHAIQLAPGIKLIANTKSGWQPYLAISMIWNILDKTNVKANDTRLPEMSIDPYLQYGLGLQKTLKNNYLAYAQAMIHSGGRNGISLSAGLRWKIGKNK